MKNLYYEYVLTEDYSSKSFVYKFIFYMLSCAFNLRAKYYCGFKMAEASVIFCGLAYDKKEIIQNTEECKLENNQMIPEVTKINEKQKNFKNHESIIIVESFN